MPIPDIELHEPRSVAEACLLLKTHGGSARVLAGGTDLIVDLKKERITGITHLISLKRIPDLRSIDEVTHSVRIGALVTPNQAADDAIVIKYFPSLREVVNVMASAPIRNMATIGGNIASAVPCSDFAPFFIVSHGEVILSNGAGERHVKVEDYIVGPRETACRDDEIITHLLVPKPAPHTGFSYKKFMLRETNGVAVAGSAAKLVLDDHSSQTISQCAIVLTAVAPTPVFAHDACTFLEGKKPTLKTFQKAAVLARDAALPISDIRGSAEYRLEIVEVLTRRALEDAFERAYGKA